MKVISEAVYWNPFNCLKVRVNLASFSSSDSPSSELLSLDSGQGITLTVKPEVKVSWVLLTELKE